MSSAPNSEVDLEATAAGKGEKLCDRCKNQLEITTNLPAPEEEENDKKVENKEFQEKVDDRNSENKDNGGKEI